MPATLRFGERPTAARVVRRQLLDRWARISHDPLNLQGGRFRPARPLTGA